MARTKDERLLITLYQEAQKNADFDVDLDPYAIGKTMGLREHAIKMMIKTLTQANFVKKVGNMVCITNHGCQLAEELAGVAV